MAFIKWNYKQAVYDYLDPEFRTPKRLKWLETLISAFEENYRELLDRREENLYLAKHTFQTASIEHLLNEKINVTGKRILIVDTFQIPQLFIGTDNLIVPDTTQVFIISASITQEYYIFNIYVPTDNYASTETIPEERMVYIGTDSYTADKIGTRFQVQMDYSDYGDSAKVAKVSYYVNQYKQAGIDFVVVPY